MIGNATSIQHGFRTASGRGGSGSLLQRLAASQRDRQQCSELQSYSPLSHRSPASPLLPPPSPLLPPPPPPTQVLLRASSFILNGFVLRYVQAELLGVVNLRCIPNTMMCCVYVMVMSLPVQVDPPL